MFNWIIKFTNWVSKTVFGRPDSVEHAVKAQEKAQVFFDSVTEVQKTPNNANIEKQKFVSVIYKGAPHWSLFRCPCGCDDVISLPMQPPHNPRWQLEKSASGLPTLFPSIWRNKGCMSHFWVKEGDIVWCRDSGTELWKAQPDIYKKRV